MSGDAFEVGIAVVALVGIPVRVDMGVLVDGYPFTIEAGDLGEVAVARRAEKLH